MRVRLEGLTYMETLMIRLSFVVLLVVVSAAPGAGSYVEVICPVPEKPKPGELIFGVNYTFWIPGGVKRLRGVIVHQHGCGAGACKGGESAAYDLHWQALAKKHDCALLGPSYKQADKQDCRKWCDPRNGSRTAFLRALESAAEATKHPELAEVPWCIWGHSGGGFWGSLMQVSDPERIVALWLRSGTAFGAWEKGQIDKPTVPAAAYGIPTVCNPGVKERDDKRFAGAWNDALAMFAAYRAKGAPICFAPDPKTGHECGDSRYLAIPYFDACLSLRLPPKGDKIHKLRPVDDKDAWLAPPLGTTAEAASAFRSIANEAGWLPNERVAKAWVAYVKTGTGGGEDTTPPPPPKWVFVRDNEITWDAEADLESGLRGFIIMRDGKELVRLAEKPVGRFGRPLFQTMSYHDTPEKPLPDMKYLDKTAKPGAKHAYEVIAVNGVGLKSEPGKPAVHAMLPRAASSLGACVEGGYVYVYGGHTGRTHTYSTKTVSGGVLRMPVAGGEWEELAPGEPVQGMALVGHAGKVYRIGGMQPRNAPEEKADNHSMASVSCYDPASKKWSALPDLPQGRSSHDAVVAGDKLYVVGGWVLDGAKPPVWCDTVDVLDLKSPKAKWASMKQPFQRRALSAFVLGGKIHVVGGLTAKGTTKKVDVFDPAANTWGEGPELVGADGVGFSVALCVAGGSAFVSGNDGKVYRLEGERWKQIATQKVARFVHRLVPGGAGKLLVVGGAAHEGNARVVEEIAIPKAN
jgi:hypothetical protein